MNNKIILPFLVAAVCASGATARTTMDVKGVTYAVDTVFHAKVGPGTTQTQLKLSQATYPLDVFYLTIDKTVPGVSIRAVCATDRVAGTARTSAMAQSKSRPGLDYFAGVNADFFSTSGTSTMGTSVVGTPTTSCTVDGEIYKTSNSNYQFSVDNDGVARICRLNYYTGTATLGAKVTLFKGVNVMSPGNGITLYTPRYWGSANQTDYAGNCNQVTAVLAPGSDPFVAGGKFKLLVTSEPSTDGDLKVPSDGYVIHGRGTSTTGCNTGAKAFVGALHPGDVVEFDNIILTPEGEAIHPYTIVSGNPKNVGGGLTLDTEAERGDAKDRHPRTGIGVSADGTKIIMMVVDGRSGTSAGVSTSMLADIMRFAGAAEGVNLDGGGSSTLYTRALGVRNRCSDGNERAVGNAVFAVLEAPEDNTVAEIRFADWVKSIPAFGLYNPVIYAYNRHGKLIDTDFQGYTLTCDGATTCADGMSVTGTTPGTFALKATYGDLEASIALTVGAVDNVRPGYDAVLLNTVRGYATQLFSNVGGAEMRVDPAAFEWMSADSDIATVGSDGRIDGVAEGTTTVTARNGNVGCTIEVTVERPSAKHHAVQHGDSQWTVGTKTGMKTVDFAADAPGLELTFTASSTRSQRISMTLRSICRAHPEGFTVKMNPGQTPVTKLSVTALPHNAERDVEVVRNVADFQPDAEGTYTFDFDLAEFCDPEDIGVYPVEFSKLAIVPNVPLNVGHKVIFGQVTARYDDASVNAVDDLDSDPVQKAVTDGVYGIDGKRLPAMPAIPGFYVVRQGGKTFKVAVK